MSERKKVLVTGSSRGIGKEIALSLAKSGFNIDVHYAHNQEKAQEVADEIKKLGVNAEILKFDIKNREECAKALSDKLYYGVVLNAGIARDIAITKVKINAEIFFILIHSISILIDSASRGRWVTFRLRPGGPPALHMYRARPR